jgi:hypothetical protein
VDLSAKLMVAEAEIGIVLDEFLQKRIGQSRTNVLSSVVVTPALKHWHTIHALSLIYADVLNRQVNQKYESKWKEYKERARRAAANYFQLGVGLVEIPLPKANMPIVWEVAGLLAPATYMVRVAWCNAIAETGSASEAVAISLDAGGGFGVRVSDTTPAGVVGFNVYAGQVDQAPRKQNQAIVGIAHEWFVPAGGLVEGAALPKGQEPDWFVRNDRVLQRG